MVYIYSRAGIWHTKNIVNTQLYELVYQITDFFQYFLHTYGELCL